MNPLHKQSPSLKLVALCSIAVLTVASFTAVETTTVQPAHAQSSKISKHPVSKQKQKSHIIKQKYKDGTFSGIGQTQIGAVEVAVTLKKDKITRVAITASSTHYPIDYINPVLPTELLQRQDINKIDIVSGATLSTEDFYYAVVYALQKAEHAELLSTMKKPSPKHHA